MSVTGEFPPTEPPTAEQYTEHGLPWFDYYDGDARALGSTKRLGTVRSVLEMVRAATAGVWPKTTVTGKPRVHALGPESGRVVREGEI